MMAGIMSDTHLISENVIISIVEELKKRKAEVIICCGDIEPQHINAGLFGGLPVICALVDKQEHNEAFETGKPQGWRFTKSGDRICRLPDGTKIYVGHKRHMDFLTATLAEFNHILSEIRAKYDGLEYIFGGHLHFQTYKKGQLISFVNPGAVFNSIGWGYEFALVDTVTHELVFSRKLPTPDDRPTFSVGVISDSHDITHRDSGYWQRLVVEMEARDVTHIIHCGNLALADIGRPELKHVQVHFAIRQDQSFEYRKLLQEGKIPENWKVISDKDLGEGAVVVINGYHFYVELTLGLNLVTKSEVAMDMASMEICGRHPQTEIVLCGFTREALYVEGQRALVINPGAVNPSLEFAVICLPRREITFGRVPMGSLTV